VTRKLPRRGTHRPPGTLAALGLGAAQPAGRVGAFEREAAATFATRHAVATGSGRLALALLLEALDLRPGDEVLVPALTFHAVPTTLIELGYRPVFVDVELDTALIDPADAARRVTARTRVVLATHLFGLPCSMEALTALCRDRGLVLLEDFAQASGARRAGRPLGSIGDAGFTSLETVKLLAAFGGGLVTTSDDALARRVRARASALGPPDLRRLATKVALAHVEAGLTHPRLFGLAWPLFTRERDSETWVGRYKRRKQRAGNHGSALHAAQAEAGRLGLRRLEAHLRQRRANADQMRAALDGCWFPAARPQDDPSWYQLVVRSPDPAACAREARLAGVDVGRDVATDLSSGACPVAARLAAELVQLPCHPPLRPTDIERVATVVKPWLR
jgi:perosamine synthetase